MPFSPDDVPISAPSLESSYPARVLVASDERTLFDLVEDPRVEVQRRFDPQREPQLIVLPSSRLDRRFEVLAEAAPAEVWRRAVIVFDGSCEGPEFAPDYIDSVHRFIAGMGAIQERCAFVTQNRNARWTGSRVRILQYDFWIRSLFSWSPEQGQALFDAGLDRFRSRRPDRPKKFITLNLTARPSRLLFLLALLRDGLWDQGYVSFAGFQHLQAAKLWSMEEAGSRLLAMPGFELTAAELVSYLPALDAKGQVLFGFVKQRPSGYFRKPTEAAWLAEYDGSWFSATTETEISASIDRITEKSVKSLLNFHPQIVLGNAGALRRLRALGFDSFAGWVEEAYDEEPDPSRRFDLAYGEIRRLCALDEGALERMETECSDLLIANARRGLVELPTDYRRTWDREIVSEILALLPA